MGRDMEPAIVWQALRKFHFRSLMSMGVFFGLELRLDN